MTLEEIELALFEGKRVYWKTTAYSVFEGLDGYYIVFMPDAAGFGHNCISLTWQDGKTLNGTEEDFFVGD